MAQRHSRSLLPLASTAALSAYLGLRAPRRLFATPTAALAPSAVAPDAAGPHRRQRAAASQQGRGLRQAARGQQGQQGQRGHHGPRRLHGVTTRRAAEEGLATPSPGKAAAVGAAAAAGAAGAAGVGLAAESGQKQKQDATQALTFGVAAALTFCAGVSYFMGVQSATEWLSCYVIEYSLSIDNLFVFIIIFKYFKVPKALQSNVLNYGILGAIIFRFVFIFLGAMVLQEFQFLILGFSAILIYASYNGLTKGDDDDDDDDENLDNNFIVQNLRKVFDVTPKFDGEKFFADVDGKTFITPLFLCLLTIEFSDIVFATDSVPAVLGTTQDPFVAYSSNIFAVYGLRALFFLLQEAMVSFSYLEYAVNFVLGFIGVKIILDFFEIVQIDVIVSLIIVLGTLGAGVILSLNSMDEDEVEEVASSEKEH